MFFFLRHVEAFIHSLRSFVLMEGMSKFTQTTYNIVNGFNGWVGQAANNKKRPILVKRLSDRESRRHISSKMAKSSGRCGCTACARRKRKNKVKSALVAEMAYQRPVAQNKMAATEEEDKMNLEVGQVNELNEQEYSQLRDYRKLQQTDFTERAWWTDLTNRVYMPPLMLQKPTKSECSSATSGFKTARSETPDPPSSSSSIISDTSDYKSCENSVSHLDLRSISAEEITKNLKTKPELPVVRSKSQPLGHQPNSKELRELQMIASRRKKIENKKRPVCRTTSHATDNFSNCVKCSRIVSRPFRNMKTRFPTKY